MSVSHVNAQSFETEVLKSGQPVLADFHAEWCGPCKVVGPIVDDIAKELQGQLKVVKIDVDQAQEVAQKFGIMSVPTLMIFKDGEAVDTKVGAHPKPALLDWIKSHI